MFYQSLFDRPADRPVRACLLGSGEFGTSFLFQAQDVPHLEVRAVCTRTVARAVAAFADAGIADARVRVCETAEEAKTAYGDGLCVVTDGFDKLVGLPLDVLVESSGAPETGADAAEKALAAGMHVIMVSKETDSVIGPLMARKAREKGLVYTTGDGDQPSMLIGLVSWARALGLNVVGAGKASEYDFVYDAEQKAVVCAGQGRTIPVPELAADWRLGDRAVDAILQLRSAILSSLTMRTVADLCEMTIVANATGLLPDRPTFHAPVVRIPELPDVFCPRTDGGIFDATGRIDIFNCLRRDDEASMAGGEFIIVECRDKKSWKVLEAKGHPVSRNGRYAAIYLPQHLLGVEVGTSVLAAAILGHSTGGNVSRPICDLQGRAVRDLEKGFRLEMGGHHHTIEGVEGFIGRAAPVAPGMPLPFYLFSQLTLIRDVPAGRPICFEDVEIPSDSVLLRLRREQDRIFGLAS